MFYLNFNSIESPKSSKIINNFRLKISVPIKFNSNLKFLTQALINYRNRIQIIQRILILIVEVRLKDILRLIYIKLLIMNMVNRPISLKIIIISIQNLEIIYNFKKVILIVNPYNILISNKLSFLNLKIINKKINGNICLKKLSKVNLKE